MSPLGRGRIFAAISILQSNHVSCEILSMCVDFLLVPLFYIITQTHLYNSRTLAFATKTRNCVLAFDALFLSKQATNAFYAKDRKLTSFK